MSDVQTPDVKPNLEKTIDRVFAELENHEPSSTEYSTIVDQLEKLYKIKSIDKKDPRVNVDSVIAVAGNLIGIVAILGFERAHVVTSKALGFVLKSKV